MTQNSIVLVVSVSIIKDDEVLIIKKINHLQLINGIFHPDVLNIKKTYSMLPVGKLKKKPGLMLNLLAQLVYIILSAVQIIK